MAFHRYLFSFLAAVISIHSAVGQIENGRWAAPIQDTIPTLVLQKLKHKLQKDKSVVTEPSGKVNTYIKKLYDERFDFVVQNFNEDYFINDTKVTPYLQMVLEKIYKANPQLPQETAVFAYRSESPNALSFGEGTIAFTLGLLQRMENEDQIAFVLCHELAHYHSRHSDLKIAALARLNYDKEIQKKIKSISRSEYGQFTKYSQLANSLGLSIKKHSRDKEFEADSIALTFFLNTSYNIEASVRTLEILDSADRTMNRKSIDLRKHYDFPNYPFKEQWLDYSKSNTWYSSKAENDSAQTHPNCKRRIEALQRQLHVGKAIIEKYIAHQPTINQIRDRISFDVIESEWHFKNYGRALFHSLLLIEAQPNDIYLHAMIGKCMYQLYRHQRDHTLSQVLILPDPRLEENYDRYLTFMHRLRLSEVAALSCQYVMTKKTMYDQDEDFLYALWLCSQIEISEEKADVLREEYLLKFPLGRYASEIKNNLYKTR